MLSQNEEIKMTFRNEIIDSSETESEFVSLLSGAAKEKTAALLSKIENDIYIIENRLITFCDYRAAVINESFDVFSVIVGQSTNITEGGKYIDIEAGVGAFSSAARPEIIINNKKTEVKDGLATLKIKAPKTPGRYKVPVIINYTNESGLKQTKSTTVEYRVVP